MNQQQIKVPATQQQLDMIKTLLYVKLAKIHVQDLVIANPNVPESIKNGTFRFIREAEAIERKFTNDTNTVTSRYSIELDKRNIWDINSLIELVVTIGNEEKPELYEEFLSMMMDCIGAILYSQVKRKNIHFGKYRALFKLFVEELDADANHQDGQFLYKNGVIYLRTNCIEQEDMQEVQSPKVVANEIVNGQNV